MKCVVGDGRLSLFDDGRFDAILAMHVLDHTPKARAYQFFRSFSSMLKPGGKLLVEGYRGQEDGIFKDGWWNNTAVYRASFLEREWKSIAEKYGFTVDLIDKAPIADQYGMINLYMLCTKK